VKVTITIDEATIKDLIRQHVQEQLGKAAPTSVNLLVKSKQNYRATWENAAIIVTNDDDLDALQEARPDSEAEIKAEVQA